VLLLIICTSKWPLSNQTTPQAPPERAVAPGHAGCASLLLSIAKTGFPYISTYRRFGRSGHLPVNGMRSHATPIDPPKCGILPGGPHGPCVQRESHSLRPKRTWWVAKKCLQPHLRGLRMRRTAMGSMESQLGLFFSLSSAKYNSLASRRKFILLVAHTECLQVDLESPVCFCLCSLSPRGDMARTPEVSLCLECAERKACC
jgi:hypothetical protein